MRVHGSGERRRTRDRDGLASVQGRCGDYLSRKFLRVPVFGEKANDLAKDSNLKRCYGKSEKIIDCTWDFLSQQRTLKPPHLPMPRLQDLLEYLASPGLEDIWLLLDIKVCKKALFHCIC